MTLLIPLLLRLTALFERGIYVEETSSDAQLPVLKTYLGRQLRKRSRTCPPN